MKKKFTVNSKEMCEEILGKVVHRGISVVTVGESGAGKSESTKIWASQEVRPILSILKGNVQTTSTITDINYIKNWAKKFGVKINWKDIDTDNIIKNIMRVLTMFLESLKSDLTDENIEDVIEKIVEYIIYPQDTQIFDYNLLGDNIYNKIKDKIYKYKDLLVGIVKETNHEYKKNNNKYKEILDKNISKALINSSFTEELINIFIEELNEYKNKILDCFKSNETNEILDTFIFKLDIDYQRELCVELIEMIYESRALEMIIETVELYVGASEKLESQAGEDYPDNSILAKVVDARGSTHTGDLSDGKDLIDNIIRRYKPEICLIFKDIKKEKTTTYALIDYLNKKYRGLEIKVIVTHIDILVTDYYIKNKQRKKFEKNLNEDDLCYLGAIEKAKEEIQKFKNTRILEKIDVVPVVLGSEEIDSRLINFDNINNIYDCIKELIIKHNEEYKRKEIKGNRELIKLCWDKELINVINRVKKSVQEVIVHLEREILKSPHWNSVYTIRTNQRYGIGWKTQAKVYDNFDIFNREDIQRSLQKNKIVDSLKIKENDLIDKKNLEKLFKENFKKDLNLFKIAKFIVYDFLLEEYNQAGYYDYLTTYRKTNRLIINKLSNHRYIEIAIKKEIARQANETYEKTFSFIEF